PANGARAHPPAVACKQRPPLTTKSCDPAAVSSISPGFPGLSPSDGQVTHVLLTRPPLGPCSSARRLPNMNPARLACVRHAASVRPEPGSNSPCSLFRLSSRSCPQKVRPLVNGLPAENSRQLCKAPSCCSVFKVQPSSTP